LKLMSTTIMSANLGSRPLDQILALGATLVTLGDQNLSFVFGHATLLRA
jgi:hypothetical protein